MLVDARPRDVFGLQHVGVLDGLHRSVAEAVRAVDDTHARVGAVVGQRWARASSLPRRPATRSPMNARHTASTCSADRWLVHGSPHGFLAGVTGALLSATVGAGTKSCIADLVGHGPHGAVGTPVEPAHLVGVERPRADAAEHGDLPAGFVDGAVAVESLAQAIAGVAVLRHAISCGFGSGEKP